MFGLTNLKVYKICVFRIMNLQNNEPHPPYQPQDSLWVSVYPMDAQNPLVKVCVINPLWFNRTVKVDC